MERYKEIERSIITRYRKSLWSKFLDGINKYELISPGDKIAVCISGGKDSMLLAKLMQEYVSHIDSSVTVRYISMDPGYSEVNRQIIEENSKLMEIPIEIFDSDVFEVVEENDANQCFLCARMRRGFLYRTAQSLGCNKIALGHHFDDVIETVLMSMLYGGQLQSMMPKLRSKNFEGIELIRPMFLIKERDIITFSEYNDLHFINCACSRVKLKESGELRSARSDIKDMIEKLRSDIPNVEYNIFKSVHDVNIDEIIGFHNDGRTINEPFNKYYKDKKAYNKNM